MVYNELTNEFGEVLTAREIKKDLTKNERIIIDLLEVTMDVLNEEERRRNGCTKKTAKEFEGLIKEISKELEIDYKKVLQAITITC